ncbi:restriction endonuclease subunit S [Psychrobacter fozii]|uniref:restriction endonuclease subunit S n=1 Tax=Psychrobacter fozii TaxID=198480 RepID=UPI00191A98C8|nr:restriction endonuclease subunit S [Psychrobacter fozii]
MVFNSVPLGELLDDKGYIRGPFGSALKRADMHESGIPVYEQQHAIDGHRNFRYFIQDNKLQKLSRFQVKPNDLIISCSGTVGRISIISDNDPIGIISQALLILRVNKEKLLPDFLYYFLISPVGKRELINASQGAVQQNIAPRAVVEKIEIPLPDLSKQRQIINQLKSIDNKRKNNTEINQTIEEVAQAIFKSWFVDFDPVKAKMNGEKPEGMDTATAELYPNKLVESEFGLIPEGWKIGNIGDIADLNASSWTKKNPPTTVNYVDLANTKNGVIEAVTRYKFEEAPSRARRVLNSGDTIVGTVRPGNRSFAYIGNTEQQLTGSTGFAVLTPKEEYWSSFVYLATTNDDSIDRYAHLADGGAYPAIKPKVVTETNCAIPIKEIAEKFWEISSLLLKQIHQNRMENQNLIELRNTLLPKLLSGELTLTNEELTDES